MSKAVDVIIPLLNPNEPEAQVTAVYVSDGQKVSQGEALCALETTKSTAEVPAEREGYIVSIVGRVGDVLRAGSRLCWIADKADWEPPEPSSTAPVDTTSLPEGLRMTAPALELARSANVDLSTVPKGPIVTEAMIRSMVTGTKSPEIHLPPGPFDPQTLVIYGGGGHAKSLIDLIRVQGEYEIIGVVDDGLETGSEIMGISVLGGGDVLSVLADRGISFAVNAVGGVGDIMSRIQVFQRILDAGLTSPTLIHPSALVEPSATLEDGIQVFPLAYIGTEVQINFGVIVNTSAVVSHECQLGAYANIAPGAVLAGGVKIGEQVLIGMGVTINLQVAVGARAKVGNGAVIKGDVPAGAVVRAGTIWPA